MNRILYYHLILLFFLSTLIITACGEEENQNRDTLSFNNLTGSWKAKAFTGELRENWKRGDDGWFVQEGFYIENGDTTYRAKTKIEIVANEMILFSVIEGTNPKIFKAHYIGSDTIFFVNTDYNNPDQVIYIFGDKDSYHRIISGVENDSLVSYKFEFTRIK